MFRKRSVSDDDAEENGDPAQNRNRLTLQFAAIRIVHQIFQQGDLNQPGMNPTDNQQRDYQRQ